MSFEQNLEKILARYKELGEMLASPDGLSREQFVENSKEYSDLGSVVESIEAYQRAKQELADLEEMLASGEADAEMAALAEDELMDLKRRLPEMELGVKRALLPKDEADAKNAILEVRAGTGGDEAALFGADLFRMYQRYAEMRGWKFEVMEISDTGIGGIKEASAVISGRGVFARMKYESGVHRVQRVPETESSGRVHTSAATVAVLPEAEDSILRICLILWQKGTLHAKLHLWQAPL